MPNQPQDSYDRLTKINHWLSALAIFGLFALGWWMVDLSYYDTWYVEAPHYHESIGILLGALTLFRLFWRLNQPRLEAISTHSSSTRLISRIAHYAMYFLLVSIIVSGYLIPTANGKSIALFNWFNLPALPFLFDNQADLSGNLHRWLAYGLMFLVGVHTLAAFKHHFLDKDDTINRML